MPWPSLPTKSPADRKPFAVDNHTIPKHKPLKVGTLNSILTDVAQHLGLDKHEFLRRLFP